MAQEEEIVKVPDKIEVHYLLSYGRISKFFRDLRDKGKILGTRCPNCGLVYCPPTSDCARCYLPTEWVELSGQGTLLAYTVCYMPPPNYEGKIPYIVGLVRLDGGDTALWHYIAEIEPEQVRKGMRVQAVLREAREGKITDISHFKPLPKEEG